MKKNHKILFCVFLVLLSSTISFGINGQKDAKNEADLLIKSARFLEEKPLDKKAKDVRRWAIEWIIATDKVTAKVCSLIISGTDKKYKYGTELFGQYTIAMAAFKLANPDKAKDEDAAQQAGVDSALTAYEAIVKEQPKATNAFLDDLLAKRSAGTLAQ